MTNPSPGSTPAPFWFEIMRFGDSRLKLGVSYNMAAIAFD
jgi:hypothetical protein